VSVELRPLDNRTLLSSRYPNKYYPMPLLNSSCVHRLEARPLDHPMVFSS